MSEIPKSWVKTCFGEVFKVRGGSQPPKSTFVYEPTDGYEQLLQIRDFGKKPVPTYVREDLVTKFCTEDDILIARYGASLGRILTGMAGAYNVALAKVIFNRNCLDPKYVFNYLNTTLFQTPLAMMSRSAQNGFSEGELREFVFPLPPLAEQKRIVAKIEELFSEMDAGEESLRRARRQLGVYRQSLLKQAFEGKLTAVKQIEKVPLRNLITGLGQGWSPKCDLNRPPELNEWAVIKTTAIQHCRYNDAEAKPLPPSLEPRPAIEIHDGDFLMTRKGPRVRAGVTCYVHRTRPRLMICDTVYRFRCIEEKVFPLYLELALNSPDLLDAIDQRKAGISESGLSLTHGKIGTVEVPLCSLPEQQEIVRLLDEQFEVIEQNEREIDAALKRSEALRQSILKKAFTGHLVPQDPTDEPASVLLDRIRCERETAEKAAKVKKKATKKTARKRARKP